MKMSLAVRISARVAPIYALFKHITLGIQSLYTLRLLLLVGTYFSVLVVCCIWQVFILAFLR